MNNFHYAQYLANELYGVEIPDDKFEEIGLIAYNRIGNKVCRNYRFFGKVDKKTLSLELPCNLLYIISVCEAWEDWEHVTNKHFSFFDILFNPSRFKISIKMLICYMFPIFPSSTN